MSLSYFFERFVELFIRDLMGYTVFTLIIFFVAYCVMKARPKRWLQPQKWTFTDTSREVALSILSFAVFAAILPFSMYVFGIMGWSRNPELLQGNWLLFFAILIAIIIFHDAWFYWTHRLLHTRWFYKYVHSVHHKSKAPTVFAAFAFHPIEAFLMAIFTPLVSVILPINFAIAIVFNVHMIIRNCMAHAGVELFPKTLLSSRCLDWLAPTSHHDTHHRYSGGNYGFYFRFWDRWMKTENERFVHVFERATEKEFI